MEKQSLEFLVGASKALNSTLELAPLLTAVRDLVVAAVACETCSVAMLGERSTRVCIPVAAGRVQAELRSLCVEPGEGVIGSVAASGTPLILNRADEIAGFADSLELSLGTPKRNSLCVPLVRGGQVIGAIEAVNKRDGDFTAEDLELLSALAEHAAIALDNTDFRERLRREAEQRRMLYEVGTRISSSLDLEEVLNLVLDCLKRVVRYDAGGVFLVNPASLEMVRVSASGYDPETEKNLELKFGEGLVGWVAKNSLPVIVPDVSKDPRYVNSRDRSQSEVAVPLMANERIVGVLYLESDRIGAFTEEDVALIQAFGSQAAISIERAVLHAELMEKRRLDDEIELAKRIQRFFLPDELPRIPGFELSAINIPSEEVGGDYYDVIAISPGHWGVVIADVFGKGFPAALVMASFRACLLAEIRNNYAIKNILAKVNRLIWESVEPDRCVTACYGVLDIKQRVLTYSNAGHVYPLIVSRDGVRKLGAGGLVLGVVKGTTYVEERVELRPGDLLLWFTDGLTDPQNDKGEMFGEERVAETARSLLDLPCPGIVKGIYDAICEFSRGMLTDDFTLLVVKVK